MLGLCCYSLHIVEKFVDIREEFADTVVEFADTVVELVDTVVGLADTVVVHRAVGDISAEVVDPLSHRMHQ